MADHVHQESRALRISVVGLLVLATIFALYAARHIIIPLLLGVMLSLLLAPVVRTMRRRLHVPTWIGSMIALTAVVGGLVYGGYRLVEPATDWASRVGDRWPEVERRLSRLKAPVSDLLKATREVENVADLDSEKDEKTERVSSGPTIGEALLTSSSYLLFCLVVIIMLAFFLLQSLDSFLAKVVQLLPRFEYKKRAVQICRDIEGTLSRYLLTVSIINACLGVAVGTVLGLAGLPNPVLWGTLAALLNFVPYLGAIVGVVIVGLVSLTTFDDSVRIFLPPMLYGIINGLEGYIITPLVLGRHLSLHPVVVFLSVIVFAWMWGPIGAFLAVPLVVSIKIAALQSESLYPVGALLMSEHSAEEPATADEELDEMRADAPDVHDDAGAPRAITAS